MSFNKPSFMAKARTTENDYKISKLESEIKELVKNSAELNHQETMFLRREILNKRKEIATLGGKW